MCSTYMQLFFCVIPYAKSLYAVLQMPNKFPDAETILQGQIMTTIQRRLVDPNVVELSREELGRRSSYDESNMSASLHRSSIRKSLQGLVGLPTSKYGSSFATTTTTKSVKRLSALIHPDEALGEDETGDMDGDYVAWKEISTKISF